MPFIAQAIAGYFKDATRYEDTVSIAEYEPTAEEVQALIDSRLRSFRRSIDTHYGIAMANRIGDWAQAMAEDIAYLCIDEPTAFPVLVYRGMSGVASATALSIFLNKTGTVHGKLYVRKDEEKSHGSSVEASDLFEMDSGQTPLYIFVDDFIDRGGTLEAVLDKVQTYMKTAITKENVRYALGANDELLPARTHSVDVWGNLAKSWRDNVVADMAKSIIAELKYDHDNPDAFVFP